MSFRKDGNRQSVWIHWRENGSDLICDLPAAIFANENVFRAYATTGAHPEDETVPKLADLPPEQIMRLWEFVNLRTQFDMDASLFDALNKTFRHLCRTRD